MFNVWDSR